jgi:hypothetical protein
MRNEAKGKISVLVMQRHNPMGTITEGNKKHY